MFPGLAIGPNNIGIKTQILHLYPSILKYKWSSLLKRRKKLRRYVYLRYVSHDPLEDNRMYTKYVLIILYVQEVLLIFMLQVAIKMGSI